MSQNKCEIESSFVFKNRWLQKGIDNVYGNKYRLLKYLLMSQCYCYQFQERSGLDSLPTSTFRHLLINKIEKIKINLSR